MRTRLSGRRNDCPGNRIGNALPETQVFDTIVQQTKLAYRPCNVNVFYKTAHENFATRVITVSDLRTCTVRQLLESIAVKEHCAVGVTVCLCHQLRALSPRETLWNVGLADGDTVTLMVNSFSQLDPGSVKQGTCPNTIGEAP